MIANRILTAIGLFISATGGLLALPGDMLQSLGLYLVNWARGPQA